MRDNVGFSIGKLRFLKSLLVIATFGASMLWGCPTHAKHSTVNAIPPAPGLTLHSAAASHSVSAYASLPLSFTANRGQTDARVKFISRGSGYTVFLTSKEAVLMLRASAQSARKGVAGGVTPFGLEAGRRPVAWHNSIETSGAVHATPDAVVRLKLAGANPAVQVIGIDQIPGKSNYFIGNDPTKWKVGVPNYAQVEYKSVYPGVDLVYYGNPGQLEYDFVVAPGANPGAIKFALQASGNQSTTAVPGRYGASSAALHIAANGDLVLGVPGGEVRFHRPLIYQPATSGRFSLVRRATQRTTPRTAARVPGKYVLKGNRVSFEIARYDRTRPLIIDPTLTYSSLIGGSGFYGEQGNAIAVDATGSVYLTGMTDSPDFPIVNQIPGACNGYCGTGIYNESTPL